LHALAPGLTPRSVLEKFAAVLMIDVGNYGLDCPMMLADRPGLHPRN
jgi:hypothetical protein